MLGQEGANYFSSRSEEEENPIIIEQDVANKYYQLEQIFNEFFPEDSLAIAKEKSKEERDAKRINDTSFAYGEVVKI